MTTAPSATSQLTMAEARARLGGLSRARLLQLDGVLQPTRDALGHRCYSATLVDQLAAERRTAAERRARGIR